MLTLFTSLILAAAPEGEVAALRTALQSAEPNPNRIAAALDAAAKAGPVEAVPLLAQQFADYGRQVRERGSEVEATLARKRQFDEVQAELKTQGKYIPALKEEQEDLQLKLRKEEARRADLERVWLLLLEKIPTVLVAVGEQGELAAVSAYTECFVAHAEKVFELDSAEEDLKGQIASLEFEVRDFEGDWREKTKLLEDHAKTKFLLDRTITELDAHRKLKDGTVRALATLMQSLGTTDRPKAVDELEDRIDKRQPPGERAKYVGLYAGLGASDTPKELEKIASAASKQIQRDTKDLDKLREQAASTRAALEAQIANQKPNADGMVMVNRRLKIAAEQAQADLEAAVAALDGWTKLQREAAASVAIAVRSLPEGTERDRQFDWLMGLAAKERNVPTRLGLIQSLGKLDRDDVRGFLRELMADDKDVRARVAAVEALVELQDRESLAVIRDELLPAEDWRLRAAAMSALARLPAKENVPALIEALRRENGRLREDAAEALRYLTAQNITMAPEVWAAWWRENEASFDPLAVQRQRRLALAPSNADDRGVTFYGISSASSRVCFVLDVSGSMQEPSVEGGDPEKVKSKIEVAMREIKQAVTALREDDTFTIVTFASNSDRWKDKMVKASESEKRKVHKWIDEDLEANGATNLHGGLMDALKIAGIGTRDAKYEPAIDTIYLLSDGDPTAGEVTDPDELRRLIREANGLNRIRIHTIAVGQEANTGLLYGLAEDSGGLFVKR